MAPSENLRYTFGPFLLDLQEQQLLRDGVPVHLTPKAFELLQVLVASEGRLVDKDTLMQRLWPDTFVEESSLTFNIFQVRQALGDDGREQRYIENVPRRGYRFCAPVTTLVSAIEMKVPDASSARGSPVALPPAPSWRWSRSFRLGSLVLLIVSVSTVLSIYAWMERRAHRNETALSSVDTHMPGTPRRSLAVLDLSDASRRPDLAWLSAALAEMFSTELSAGDALRTIPRERVAQMQIDLSLSSEKPLTRENLAHIRDHQGTDRSVVGAYYVLGDASADQIRVDIHVRNAMTDDVLASIAETGRIGDLFGLVSHSGARLRDALRAGEVSAVDAEGVRASLPSDPAARRPYVEGLTRLRRSDALAARDLFLKAASAEPNSPLVHARLADAWSALGYDDHARAEAKAAFDLSGRLMQPQRLWIEANLRRMTREWDLAVEIYHRLQGFFPDDPECALQLAEVQTAAGRSKEALSTIEMFKRWPTPLGDNPRLDLAEAVAARDVGDLPRQLQAAQRAVSKGSAQHARSTMAYGGLQEGRAYSSAARRKDAIDAATRAKETFAALGDQARYARALMDVANHLRIRGNVVARRAMYEEARTVYRQIGHKKGEANSLNNIAGVFETLGDIGAAQRHYEEAFAIRREIDDRQGVALSLNNIADTLQWQGDLASARRMFEQALTAYRRTESPDGIALVLTGLSEVFRFQGELARARTMAEDSVIAWRAIGTRNGYAAGAYRVLGDVQLDQGDLTEALSAYEEALAMEDGASGKTTAAATRLHIARLWIEEGRSAQAEPVIRQTRELFHGEGETLHELQANVLLTKALLDQGKPTEAESAVEDGKRLGAQTRSKIIMLELAIVTARVRAAKGNVKSAIESLKAVLAATQRCGCLDLEFEARLVLSRIELNTGERQMGQAHLAWLQREADAKGFALIARKAKAAMAGP